MSPIIEESTLLIDENDGWVIGKGYGNYCNGTRKSHSLENNLYLTTLRVNLTGKERQLFIHKPVLVRLVKERRTLNLELVSQCS